MSNDTLPGVALSRTQSRMVGLCLLATVAILTTVALSIPSRPDGTIAVVLESDHVPDGITEGTVVRLDGLTVGQVSGIDLDAAGTPSMRLHLDQSQLFGLTDTAAVTVAPANLFGIAEVGLASRTGGAPLEDGSILRRRGEHQASVDDATMSNLIRSLGDVTAEVLTPRLTEVLNTLATSVGAFTPALTAIVVSARSWTETQIYPISVILKEYEPLLRGLGAISDGAIKLFDKIANIEPLRTLEQRELVADAADTLANGLAPAVIDLLKAVDGSLGGFLPAIEQVLQSISRVVPQPQQSGRQFAELLDRLDKTIPITPNGPTVRVLLILRDIPALAQPLGLTGPGAR